MVTLGNDIALVRLDRPVTTHVTDPDSPVGPVCLAWDDDDVPPPPPRQPRTGDDATVVGWGRITNSDVSTIK